MSVTTSTNIPSNECTPNITSQMQPITLFRTHEESSPSISQEPPPSNDICENKESEDSLVGNKQSYQTKGARMIERTIGKTIELGKYEKQNAQEAKAYCTY